MQFTVFTLLLWILNFAIASPTPESLVKRELPVETAFRNAGNALANVEASLRAWPRNRPQDIKLVENTVFKTWELQQRVIDELRLGAREVYLGADISAWTVTLRSDWLTAFTSLMQRTMVGWQNGRQYVQAIRKEATIRNQLVDLSMATAAFHDAISLKLPYLLQSGCRSGKQTQVNAIEFQIKNFRS